MYLGTFAPPGSVIGFLCYRISIKRCLANSLLDYLVRSSLTYYQLLFVMLVYHQRRLPVVCHATTLLVRKSA